MNLSAECSDLNQFADWFHRGNHDIVKHMSFYIYSLLVSRVDVLSPASTPNHLDIPIDEAYAAPKIWVQRILVEPCISRLEGSQFMIHSDPEMYYMCMSGLPRPISIHAQDDSEDSLELYTLKAYPELCKASEV